MSTNNAIHTVAFEVIEKCNLFCDFCVRSAAYGLSGIVTLERFRARVESVSNAFPGLKLIAITGGEPFLHPQLCDLVRIATEAGTQVCITTNGTLVRRDDLEEYAQNKRLHLIISIDGPTAPIHDAIRGRSGAFNQLMRLVETCQQLKIPFLVNMTVGEANYRHVYDTVLLARRLGALDICVALVKPEGRGKQIANGQVVFAEVGRQVMLAKRDLEPHLIVRFIDPLAHIVDVSLAQPGVRGGCGAGVGALHVQCNGNVLICTAGKESLGNIDEIGHTLSERAHADAGLEAIIDRSALGGACGSCEFREACGGCRCRAAAMETGFLGADPLCPKNVNIVDSSEIERVFQDAHERLKISNARSPSAVTKYLEQWKSGESSPLWNGVSDLDKQKVPVLRKWLQSGLIRSDVSNKKILGSGFSSIEEPLLLAALGAHVDAFEALPSNEQAIRFLADQYGLPVRVFHASVNELEKAQPISYDLVYLSGNLTYLIILEALCIAFERLVDGGQVLIEIRTGCYNPETDRYSGLPHLRWAKRQPSRLDVLEMLKTVGFQNVRILDFDRKGRFCVSGQRIAASEL